MSNSTTPATQAIFPVTLKERRERLGLTLRDVEEISKGAISNSYLSQLETGKIKNPSLENARILATIYHCQTDDIAEALSLPIPAVPFRCHCCGQSLLHAKFITDTDDGIVSTSDTLARRMGGRFVPNQAHHHPGDVGMREALSELWSIVHGCDLRLSVPMETIHKVRAALAHPAQATPSALSGDDLAKGLRTSQKALDEIARQEQANIAGYLALRDFPIGSASAQFPPDEVGPNALGSDSPSISAQLREISRISNKYDLRECIEGHDDALGDSYIWRDLMEQCEKLGIDPSALSGDAGEGE